MAMTSGQSSLWRLTASRHPACLLRAGNCARPAVVAAAGPQIPDKLVDDYRNAMRRAEQASQKWLIHLSDFVAPPGAVARACTWIRMPRARVLDVKS
jgi:hypothetical protein